MDDKKSIKAAVLGAAITLLIVFVAGLFWKFIGPGSAPPPPKAIPEYRIPTGQVLFGTPAEPPPELVGRNAYTIPPPKR